MSVYLFDLAGEPIAFRRSWSDPHVFALDGHWIGWFPWNDNHAISPGGDYLGTVVDDRLVRRNDWCVLPCSQTTSDPGVATADGSPPVAHPFPNRFAYTDIQLEQAV